MQRTHAGTLACKHTHLHMQTQACMHNTRIRTRHAQQTCTRSQHIHTSTITQTTRAQCTRPHTNTQMRTQVLLARMNTCTHACLQHTFTCTHSSTRPCTMRSNASECCTQAASALALRAAAKAGAPVLPAKRAHGRRLQPARGLPRGPVDALADRIEDPILRTAVKVRSLSPPILHATSRVKGAGRQGAGATLPCSNRYVQVHAGHVACCTFNSAVQIQVTCKGLTLPQVCTQATIVLVVVHWDVNCLQFRCQERSEARPAWVALQDEESRGGKV